MIKNEVKKYVLIAVLLIFVYLAFLIIKPFIAALLTSFVLAYLFYPLYKKLNKITKSEIISATITTALVTIIMFLPLIYIANALVSESLNLYRQGIIEQTSSKLSVYLEGDPILSQTINELIGKAVIYIKIRATNFISNVPLRVLELIIAIYATFACFIVGERFLNKVKKILPVKKKDYLIKDIGETTHAIVYGLFLSAIIQFVIALVAFKIMSAPAALLLSLIVGFLAFIPFLGPSIVWIPYVIIEAIRNNYTNVIILIILGIILFIVETFVKSKIIGDRAKIHPVIILIGTIGGIKLFGFIGLIVGPILLSTIATIIEEYYPEIENEA